MDGGSIASLVIGIILTIAMIPAIWFVIGGMAEDLPMGWLILLAVLAILGLGIFLICLGAGAVH